MSNPVCEAGRMGEPYYFGRRSEAPTAPAEGIVRQFVVSCVRSPGQRRPPRRGAVRSW